MLRGNRFVPLLGLFILVICGFNSCAKPREQPQQPNLVFVFADQLRYDWLGYAGDEKAITPHLDRLATEGLSFGNAVVVSPVCTAMRASLFTGKYTSSTGMVVNEIRINPNHRCIGHVLTDNGYNTGYIGKWHLWANQAGHHNDPKNAYIPPGPYRLGFDGMWKAFNFHHINYDAYYFEDSPERIFYGDDVYEPEAQFNFAIDFIEEASTQDTPFALFLSVGIPHPPWRKDNIPEEYYAMFKDTMFPYPETWSDVPDPYMDRNKDPERWLNDIKPQIPEWTRIYYAMVTSLDTYMGRLMDQLKELGLEDNTILVFTSDHGEMMGEKGRIQKMIFYDSAARVPFLIKWPGKVPAGEESDALLNTPDIMPTLLSLMGLPVPEEVEGMDLSHLALGEQGKEGKEPEMAFLQGMGHTYLWIDGAEWRAVRNKQYTYAAYLVDGKELLFDHRNDPGQEKNLVGDPNYSDVLYYMNSWMREKMAELNDEFKPCTWYRDHWTDGNRNIIASARGLFEAKNDELEDKADE
jgi:arylsulfatase A-like enzyme